MEQPRKGADGLTFVRNVLNKTNHVTLYKH